MLLPNLYNRNLTFQHRAFFALLILKILVEIFCRVVSPAGMNSLFFAAALFIFLFLILPGFLIHHIKKDYYLQKYKYLILFSFFLMIRITDLTTHAIMSYLLIVMMYVYFIYASETAMVSESFYDLIKPIILGLYKFTILFCIIQILIFLVQTRLSISAILEVRPAKGYLFHENNTALLVLPATIYFYVQKDYKWAALGFFAYAGTVTKSCLIMLVCCSYILYLLHTGKKVLKRHVFFAAVLMLLVNAILILKSVKEGIQDVDLKMQNSDRMSLDTFAWRVEVWFVLIRDMLGGVVSTFIGKGLDSADLKLYEYLNRGLNLYYRDWGYISSHSDYVRILYGTGFIGLALFFLVKANIINLALKTKQYGVMLMLLVFFGSQMFECVTTIDQFMLHYIIAGLEIGNALRNRDQYAVLNIRPSPLQ